MSKSSRARWNARQRQLANTMKAVPPQRPALVEPPAPIVREVHTVERNPFVPAAVEPRGDARVMAHKDPTKEYVPSRTVGYYPFLQALPPYIDDISQQFGAQIYDQMLYDAVVYSSLQVFVLAILSRGAEFAPSLTRQDHDYDVAKKFRDLVEENLKETETPYTTILQQHLGAMARGSSVHEQVYYVEEMKYTRKPPQLRLKDIRDKPLSNAVFVVDSFFNTVGIMTQRFPGQNFPAGAYIPIDFSAIGTTRPGEEFDLSNIIPGFLPRHSFSVLTNEPRFNDERGRSVLRAAYQPWWLKQQTVAEWLAYLSKYATPSLVGLTAPNAQPQVMLNSDLTPLLDGAGNPIMRTPEQIQSDALAAFQNGSSISMPAGSEVQPIIVPGDGETFAKALAWCDKQIAYAITAQSLATQEGLHQSKASSETHQDIISLGILWRKHWLAQQQQREVFARLLRYNFDITGKKIARYIPKLVLGLGDGFPITPQALSGLMTSKYFGETPDPAQMEKLDGLLGIPVRERVMPSPPGAMPGQPGQPGQPVKPGQPGEPQPQPNQPKQFPSAVAPNGNTHSPNAEQPQQPLPFGSDDESEDDDE